MLILLQYVFVLSFYFCVPKCILSFKIIKGQFYTQENCLLAYQNLNLILIMIIISENKQFIIISYNIMCNYCVEV